MKNTVLVSLIALSAACTAAPASARADVATMIDQSQDQAENSDQILVTASRVTSQAGEIGSAVSVLTAWDLKANQTGFVLQALLDVPGVYLNTDRPGDGNISSVSIRGSTNDEVLWLIDGIKLGDPSLTSTQYLPDNLTSADISRIEVMRGNQSSLYGSEAIGGVINVVTRRATQEGLQVSAEGETGSYGEVSGGATLLGKSGPLDFRMTVTGYNQDGPSSEDPRSFNPPITNAQAEQDKYWRYGFTGRVGYQIGQNFSLMATGFWQDSHTDYDGTNYAYYPAVYPEDTSDYVKKREYAAGVKGEYESDDDKWKVDLTGSRYNARRLYFGIDNSPAGDLYEGTRDEVTANVFYGGISALSLNVGGNYEWEHDNQNAYGSVLLADVHTGSVYGEAALRPLAALTLTGAVRYDDNSRFGSFTTWRVTGAYVLGQAKLRASYGTGAKAPGLYQLFDPVYGNPDLKPETSHGGDVGVDLAVNAMLSAQLTYFYNHKHNEIGFTYAASCVSAYGCYQQFGRSKAQGVELGLTLKPLDWLSLAQSFSYVDYRQDPSTAGDQPYVDPGEPRYVGTTSVTVNPVRKASATIRVRYQDRNLTGYYGPTSAYAVVDLLGSYRLTDQVELYARVVNLFDKWYQITSGFQTLGTSAYGGIRIGL
jgi:vitamin B12 transporter